MEGISCLLMLPIMSNLVLGSIVLYRDVRDKTFRIFFALCSLVTLWGIATLVYVDYRSLIAARLSFALGIWILTMALLFARNYPAKQGLPPTWRAGVLGASTVLSILSLTGAVLASFPPVVFGPLLLLYLAYFFALFIATLSTFILRFRRSSGRERQVLLFVLLSCILSILWGTVFDLVIPVIRGDVMYNRIGVLTAPFLTLGIGNTIIRHRLFNIQLQTQRLINLLVPVGATSALTIAAGFLLNQLGLLLNPLVASALLMGAIGLYEALRHLFVKTWVGHMLFRGTYRFHERLLDLAARAAEFPDLDELAGALKRTFTESGVSGFGLFIVTEPAKRAWIPHEVTTISFTHLALFCDPDLHAELFDYLVTTAGPLVVDELPYHRPAVTARLQAALKELTGSVCVPLLVGHDLVGVVVLGAFANRRAYTSEDVEVLHEVSVPCAVALAKARLLADYRYRANQLELDKRNLEASIVELRRIKSSFLDIVDHQFNTPLSVIKSTVAMIREGDVQLSEVKQFLDTAAPRIDEFDQIIQGMLTAAHLDGTRAELRFAPVDANTALKGVIEDLKPLSAERHVAVRCDIASELPRILSDPGLFKDALRQLIKNAFIYGRDGMVRVQTHKQDSQVVITIKDTGRGFNAEEGERIGEKFYRGAHIADYLANGSGLGVFIAKRVIEASGGQLTWHSNGLGKGAEFMIKMPRATVSVAQTVGA